jgi:hypothetical protein
MYPRGKNWFHPATALTVERIRIRIAPDRSGFFPASCLQRLNDISPPATRRKLLLKAIKTEKT